MAAMLLDGFNHVAVLTADTDRLIAFYTEMFGAEVDGEIRPDDGMRLTPLRIGAMAELNVFEIDGNGEAASRLMKRGASDGFVTDFGPVLSLFFQDPDGLEAEVCVPNPDARPGVMNPPGTPAARYQ